MIAKTREQPAPSVSSPSAPPAQASRQKELESKTSLSKSAAVAGNKRDEDAELDKQRLAETLPNASGERRQADAPEEALQTKDNRVDSLGDAVVASRATAGPVASPKPDDTKASKREFSPEKAMKAPVVSNEVALARAAAAPLPAPPPPPLPAKASEASLDAQQAKAEPGGLAGFYKAKDDGYVGRGAAIGRLRSDINPRWQLSAEGKLIRSGDLGKSWQTVQVADKVVFRALCVADREVWVGGGQGNLFYSSDAGQHWEQVKPSANGQILTADITTIEFKDPQHGKLTTANHQAWTTSDGGHAWQVETR